ncbi:MAG: DUF2892 domain-containing protein [Candidatus Omnitrophica bacterium]|nr:DUF2892 domain-containing protein [Candidatus Omnitrophota bacterium]
MERALRGIAGFIIILSLLLAHYVDMRWLWFTAFVGINLFQPAFTNGCPMMVVFRKCGRKKSRGALADNLLLPPCLILRRSFFRLRYF